MKKHIFIFLISIFNLNAATHIVTTEANSGDGSLRKIIADANAGDTIKFASDVNNVILTTGQINITKSLTIIGKEEEKTIISNGNDKPNMENRIFAIETSNIIFNIKNLILEKGKSVARSGCIDIYHPREENNNVLTALNCIFRNNEGAGGGAVFLAYSNNKFIAINCLFYKNKSIGAGGAVCLMLSNNLNFTAMNCAFIENEGGSASAVVVTGNSGTFFALDCSFEKNKSLIYTGGAITSVRNDSIVYIINCSFYENESITLSGAIDIRENSNVYLYHSTLDKNKVNGNGGAINIDATSKLYSYNNIYTANEEYGVVSEAGQIRGEVSGTGKNLIDNGTTITREKVFGENEYKDGYIMPLEWVKSAPRLTTIDIEDTDGIKKDSILFWLSKDYLRKERPDTGYVTYGAVEYDSTYGIKNTTQNQIYIFPIPATTEIKIIFVLEKNENIGIDIIDLEGKFIENIFSDFAEGILFYQTFSVNHLAPSTYFLRIKIGDKIFYEKFIKK